MKGYLPVSILIALVMAFFSVQNAQTVRVSFMTWFFESPLAVMMLLSFGAGAATAYLASLPGKLRLMREIRDLKRLPPPSPSGDVR